MQSVFESLRGYPPPQALLRPKGQDAVSVVENFFEELKAKVGN